MIKKIKGEVWKSLKFKGAENMRNKYAISSNGRAASFQKDVYEDGKLLEGSVTSGYKTLNLRIEGKSNTFYIHREVAKLFHKKNSPKQKIVVHINHDKTDNNAKNLKWVNQNDAIGHQQNSPQKLAYKQIQTTRKKGIKLNASQVKVIKNLLANPKRKLTHQQIADKYNVTLMTIYRIKSGESWNSIN